MRHFLPALGLALFLTLLSTISVQSVAAEQVQQSCGVYLDPEIASSGDSSHSSTLWSGDIVIAGLRALHAAGYDELTATFLSKSKDTRAVEVLAKAIGFKTTLKVLYSKALEYFDNELNSALEAAGLPTNEISNKAQNWIPAIAIKGLRALANEGYYPSRAFLTRSKDPNALSILIKAVGFKTTLSTLYNQTLKLNNGDFIGALKVAEIDEKNFQSEQNEIPKSSPQVHDSRWTKRLVRLGMRTLYENDFIPTYKWLQKSHDPEATRILSEAVGFATSLRTLHRYAMALYNDDFRQVLIGCDLTFLIDYYAKHEWTKEDVRAGLRALYEHDFSPSTTMLQTSKDSEAKRILIDAVGFETTLNTLYEKAMLLYDGIFARALRDADLPEDEIILANRKGIDPLALVSLQYEWTHTDAGLRLVPYIGEPHPTPLDNMQNREIIEVAIRSLPADLRTLGEEVIDVILYSNLRETNAVTILAQINKDDGQGATLEKIQIILRHMANSQELRDYLR